MTTSSLSASAASVAKAALSARKALERRRFTEEYCSDEQYFMEQVPYAQPHFSNSGGSALGGANAPEFIPKAMQQQQQQQQQQQPQQPYQRQQQYQPQQQGVAGQGRVAAIGAQDMSGMASQDPNMMVGEVMDMNQMIDQSLTTIIISGLPPHTSATFKEQLDTWGLLGTYNFIHMQSENDAVVNFIDPMFASLCLNILQQCQFEGVTGLSQVQGLENNIAHFNTLQAQMGKQPGADNEPLIFQTPVPSEWAVNGVNSMLATKFSPQIRGQFHKTKLCTFHKKKRCALGSSCPFAHSKEELQQAPDLHKTKLCYNFFRRRCQDKYCKFAHGYQELRATSGVYKTELCRWWTAGACKAGNACRYAHGVEELRDWSAGDTEVAGGRTSFQALQAYKDMQQKKVEDVQEWRCPQASKPPQEDLISEADSASISELSSLNATGPSIYRQQTAPPAYNSIPEMPTVTNDEIPDGFVLRVKGTFMEAVQLKAEPPVTMRRRSWSDGDLPQLSEVIAGMEDEEEEDQLSLFDVGKA